MKSNDILSTVIDALKHLQATSDTAINTRTTVNRGVCAGSVTYTAKPTDTTPGWKIIAMLIEAFDVTGVPLSLLRTKPGQEAAERLLVEAIRNVCSENHRVNFANVLTFAPRVYADDNNQAYMWSQMINHDFMKLPNKVKLDKSLKLLRLKREEALANPFNSEDAAKRARTPKRHKRAGRVTHVTCPNCGEQVVIANTEA